jgi:hypothetical protein
MKKHSLMIAGTFLFMLLPLSALADRGPSRSCTVPDSTRYLTRELSREAGKLRVASFRPYPGWRGPAGLAADVREFKSLANRLKKLAKAKRLDRVAYEDTLNATRRVAARIAVYEPRRDRGLLLTGPWPRCREILRELERQPYMLCRNWDRR